MLDLLPAGLPAPAAGWFTSRTGGTSAPPYDALNLGVHVDDQWSRVQANRELVARAAGLDDDALVFAQQVHGAGVAVVDRSSSRGRNGGVAGEDEVSIPSIDRERKGRSSGSEENEGDESGGGVHDRYLRLEM